MQNLTNEEQVVVIQARTVLTLAEKVTADALGGGLGPFWLSSEEMLSLEGGAPRGWDGSWRGAGSTKPGCSGGLAHTWVRQHPPGMSPQG